jgi:hypothetical protein
MLDLKPQHLQFPKPLETEFREEYGPDTPTRSSGGVLTDTLRLARAGFSGYA